MVGELLKKQKFSLQANSKTREGADNPDRDAQFREASAFPLAEERQVVRAWIEANYKAVVRPAYRQKNFEALLAKLK